MQPNIQEITKEVEKYGQLTAAISAEVKKVIVGQDYLIERLLIGLLANGHILVEGVPGLAKTTAVKTLARSVDTSFQRIQFTPDLLPADLIGTQIYEPKTGNFNIKKGPLFSNIILADEINRAPAKGAKRASGGHAGAPGDNRRDDLSPSGPVSCHGHAEPHRAGRHLSAARGAG